MNTKNLISWILRIVVAVILLQTLYFKFNAAPESVYIFTTLGVEPFGRIGSGVVELIASILILIPSTKIYGFILSIFTMLGAIFSHLFILGIEVQNDGGELFFLGLIVFVFSIILLLIHKNELKKFKI